MVRPCRLRPRETAGRAVDRASAIAVEPAAGHGDTGHGTPREACRCALSGRLPAAGITHVGVQIL